MRRTLGLVVGVCATLTVAGVAGATDLARTGGDTRGAAYHSIQGPATDVAEPRAEAAAPAGPARRSNPSRDAVGREQVGALERVERILGYAAGERSTTFRYPRASYVKVHFSRLLLLPGDHLTVADPSGTEVHRYESDPLGAVADLASDGRWAMSVDGDTAVVTLHRAGADPLGVRESVARLGVSIDKVAHGFTPAERARRTERTGREESVCGGDDKADAVCYRSTDPVAYKRSKAVARLLIDGTELCTAWRLGAGNRMVTNNHCIENSGQAYNTEVWFNYQCAACGGWEVFRSTKVWGDRVLATDDVLDFTVFTLEDFAAVQRFGYLELDLRRPTSEEVLYIPQHPGGDPTTIAMDSDEDRGGTCAVDDPSYEGYAKASDVSYFCDTAGGSSGSPVLSKSTDKVIALHHFGGCPNSGVRVDLIHNKIKSLL
jgi:hypothetical protein